MNDIRSFLDKIDKSVGKMWTYNSGRDEKVFCVKRKWYWWFNRKKWKMINQLEVIINRPENIQKVEDEIVENLIFGLGKERR